MSDEKNTTEQVEASAPGFTLEQLRDVIREETAASEEKVVRDFDEKIEALRKPNRDAVPEYVNRHGEKVTKLRNASERRYARLSEDEKQYRDDESDHWAAEWIRSLATGNRPAMHRAAEKIDAYYGRASTLEGTADLGGDLSSGTGGPLLPIPIAGLVQVARDKRSVGRRLFRVWPMREQTRRISTVGAATAAMVAEGSTAAQGEPTPGVIVLAAKKIQCLFKASVEMLADSAFDVVSIYSQSAGTAIGAKEDVQFATSDGIAPNIQEALAGQNVDEAAPGTLTMEDVIKLFFSCPQPYRAQGVFLGNAVTLRLVSQLVDGASGAGRQAMIPYGAGPAGVTDVGGSGVLLGRPVVEFPLADGTLWFGDPMAAYAIGDRQQITASVSEHVDFASDLVNFKFTARFDGVNVDDGATGASWQMAGLSAVA